MPLVRDASAHLAGLRRRLPTTATEGAARPIARPPATWASPMGPAPPFRQGLGALTLSTLGSPLPHLAPGEYNPGPLNHPRGGGQLELPRRTLSTVVALQLLLRVAKAEQDPGCNPLVTASPPLGRETGRGGGLDEHAALLWLLRPAATRTASTSEPKQLVVVAVVMMMAMATRPTGLGFDLAATWLRLCLGLHP